MKKCRDFFIDLNYHKKATLTGSGTGAVVLCKVTKADNADMLVQLKKGLEDDEAGVLVEVNLSAASLPLTTKITFKELNPSVAICADSTLKNFFSLPLKTGATNAVVDQLFLFTCDEADNAAALKSIFGNSHKPHNF